AKGSGTTVPSSNTVSASSRSSRAANVVSKHQDREGHLPPADDDDPPLFPTEASIFCSYLNPD
ncbi:unnamed protein product, partial [Amoebophrya sp. A120]